MSRSQKHLGDVSKDSGREQMIQVRKQIARTTKRHLILLLALLTAIFLVFIFKIGGSLWPIWLITHRTQIIGFLVLAILVVFFSSPLIIEASSNSRPLSGPGKNPKWGYWD